MDRIDLFINVPAIKFEKLIGEDKKNYSQELKDKVIKAREIQKERYKDEKFLTNSEIPISKIKKYCGFDNQSEGLLRNVVDSGKLSARGFHRVLKTSRTIADLKNSEKILFEHLSEALSYRLREED
jgi:magnesium chelatase family protein